MAITHRVVSAPGISVCSPFTDHLAAPIAALSGCGARWGLPLDRAVDISYEKRAQVILVTAQELERKVSPAYEESAGKQPTRVDRSNTELEKSMDRDVSEARIRLSRLCTRSGKPWPLKYFTRKDDSLGDVELDHVSRH